MRLFTRPYNPPWLWNTLLTIQDVAELQQISKMSLRAEAQLFQNHSNAVKKEPSPPFIQDNSSKNTTFLSFLELSNIVIKEAKASNQFFGIGIGVLEHLQRAW